MNNSESFGWAVKQLQNGNKVARSGWNGKGMYLFHISSWGYTLHGTDVGHNYPNLPFIAMKTADDKVVPWLASQTDVLALDWSVV